LWLAGKFATGLPGERLVRCLDGVEVGLLQFLEIE
jgi:hypothetical protein